MWSCLPFSSTLRYERLEASVFGDLLLSPQAEDQQANALTSEFLHQESGHFGPRNKPLDKGAVWVLGCVGSTVIFAPYLQLGSATKLKQTFSPGKVTPLVAPRKVLSKWFFSKQVSQGPS